MADFDIQPNPNPPSVPPAEGGSGSPPEGQPEHASPPSDNRYASGDAPAPSSEGQAPTPEETSTPPEGSVRLPNGDVVTLDEVQAWRAESQQREAPQGTVQQLLDRIAQLEQRLTAPQQPTVPQVVDALRDPQRWLQVRAQEYRAAGMQPDDHQLRTDLLQQQNRMLMEQFESNTQALQRREEEARLAAETSRIEREIDQLRTKYPVLSGETGRQMFDAFLSLAAQSGETNLENVARRVAEMAPKFVMEAYGNRKKETIRSVSSNAPRGGGIKAPQRKDYGSDLSSFDRLADDLANGRR